MSPYNPPEEKRMLEETKTIPALSGRKEIAKAPSLPECLKLVTGDSYRPSLCVGFTSHGEWVPPASLSEEEFQALPEAIESFESGMVPADWDLVRILLTRLSINLRLEDMSEEAWKIHLEDFIRDLAEVPADIVFETCNQWRRTKKFWPTISEFLELVRPALHERRRWLERLMVLSRIVENPAPGGTVTAEWINSVKNRRPTPARNDPVLLAHALPKLEK